VDHLARAAVRLFFFHWKKSLMKDWRLPVDAASCEKRLMKAARSAGR